jgi:hypothetical protein
MTAARRTTWVPLLVALLLAWPGSARAQVPPEGPLDPELKAIVSQYDHGHYEAVLSRARGRIDRGGLSRDELVLLHQYAGLSAFNLGDEEGARRHFAAALRLDPDFGLDPYSISPPAIAAFTEVKRGLEPQLEIIRQQRRVEADRLRQQAEDRARRQRDEEERRRRLEEISRQVTVRNVEKRSFLVNFVPFGAAQFQQKRNVLGVILAASEGLAAATSIVSYFVLESMVEEQRPWIDTLEGRKQITRRFIPTARKDEYRAWQLAKFASAGAFYSLHGYGVVDGIYHHQGEVVTTTTVQIPAPGSPAPSPQRPAEGDPAPEEPEAPPPGRDTVPLGPGVTGQAPQHKLFLFPTPGGIGAGLHLKF